MQQTVAVAVSSHWIQICVGVGGQVRGQVRGDIFFQRQSGFEVRVGAQLFVQVEGGVDELMREGLETLRGFVGRSGEGHDDGQQCVGCGGRGEDYG